MEEASQLLVKIINDDGFNSMKKKSKHEVFIDNKCDNWNLHGVILYNCILLSHLALEGIMWVNL